MHKSSSGNLLWLKVMAALLALGLHALVIAMALSKPVTEIAPAEDAGQLALQFVDLNIDDEAAEEAQEEVAEEEIPEPELEPEPIAEEDYLPEPDLAPIPEPELVVDEPDPDDMVEEIKPEPKPEPTPKPKPKPVVKPVQQPVKTASKPAKATKNSASAKAVQGPVDPDRPRNIGKADYMGKKPNPVYPRISQRMGEQGQVMLRVLISPEGTVLKADIRKSSGFDRLDKAAVDAVKKARFKPYTENGIAYKAIVDIPFDFIL